MGINQEGILEAILYELKCIVGEIEALRSDLMQINSESSTREIGETITMLKQTPLINLDASEDAFLNTFDWLASRNITVKNYKKQEAADDVFDQLATFLGERFDSLRRLHDQIRRYLANESNFTLNLSSSSQEEIANSTQFCTLLHQYAFLSSYRYNKYSKTIYAMPQRVGKVINFFTGGWFERFIFLKTSKLLAQNNLEYVWVINPQISLPNGDDFELDLFFLVENEPLWLECKTGEYANYIAKYADMRPILTVPKERAVLVILGIPDDLTSHLTDLYNLTIANENNFLNKITLSLGLSDVANDITPISQIQPGKLSTLLKKAGLRPLPEIRATVIAQLIEVVQSMDGPSTLTEIKAVLAEKIQTSKSKLQDILNAIFRSGCFVDEQDEIILSCTTPFYGLISLNPDEIEKKCLESYVRAVLKCDVNYFDNEKNIVEFIKLTDGKFAIAEIIEEVVEIECLK